MALRRVDGAAARARDHMLQAVFTSAVARPLFHFRLIEMAALARDRDLVRRIARALVTRWPGDPAAHLWSGRGLVEAGLPAEGLPFLRDAVRMAPEAASVRAALAGALYRAEGPDASRAELEAALAIDPGEPTARVIRAHLHARDEDIEAAAADLRRALERLPLADDVWYDLGETLAKLGRLEEAEDCYARAVAIDPDYAPFHGRLAEALAAQGRIAEAEAAARNGVDADLDLALERVDAWVEAGYTVVPATILRRAHELRPELESDDETGALALLALDIQAGFAGGRDAGAITDERRRRLRQEGAARFARRLDDWRKMADGGFLERRRLAATLKEVAAHPAMALVAKAIASGAIKDEESATWKDLLGRFRALRAD
ncbi:MAG: tetratricopeptide repeat protein [Planctomycetota bacterium]